MKDLYRRLGIAPDATDTQVKGAIARARDARLRRDAEHVLLDPERRAVYDRTRRTLRTLAVLRGGLRLDRSGLGDFAAGAEDAPPAPVRRGRGRWLAGAVIAALAVGAVALFSGPDEGRNDLRALSGPGVEPPQARGGTAAEAGIPPRAWAQPLDTRRICELQELLAELGLYGGAVDGVVAPPTLEAVDRFGAADGTPQGAAPSKGLLAKVERTHAVKARAGRTTAVTGRTLPSNGRLFTPPEPDAVGTFKVQAPDEAHAFVKLIDAASGRIAAAFFVRAGHSAQVEVPLGTYRLRYAAGTQWFGHACLFGRNTQFRRAEGRYPIERWRSASGERITRQLVDLAAQLGRGPRTVRIRSREF